MSTFDVLRAYLLSRSPFTEEELEIVRAAFVPLTLRCGEYLQRGGELAKHGAFVASGCLRKYVIDADGKEHIVQFAPETWWTGDGSSVAAGLPSQYFIDALEDSELLLINLPSQMKLLQTVPAYAAGFQVGIQKHAAAKDRRIVNTLSMSAEERYLEFLRTYPTIAARVPQRMLASYLGLTPETLSRVRKNLSRRGSTSKS